VSSNAQEVAAGLWKAGLHRWTARNPDWAVGQPEFHEQSVTFSFGRDGRTVRLRVEPAGAPGEPLLAGPSLQVAVLDDGEAPDVAQGLARLIAVLDRKRPELGPRLGRSHGPDDDTGGPAWRELFIADACNLKCQFCCEALRIGQGTFMAWEEIERNLRSFAAQGVRVVQFMGGEPSIHPRFADALRLSRDLGLRNYAITNLLRWKSRAFAEEVGPLLDELMISMHAGGKEAGGAITGKAGWWDAFQVGVQNAKETLTGRIYGATVLSKHSVADLEAIADAYIALGAQKWVMGNSVPIDGAPKTSLDLNLSLTQQRHLMDRFGALHARCQAGGVELIFFCIPDCVLAEDLWPWSHDRMLHDQDLSGVTGGDAVNFWSRTDFQDEDVRAVQLGRRFSPGCDGCARKGTCGGYFGEYLDAFGAAELSPFPS
jgi:hypothetical protein